MVAQRIAILVDGDNVSARYADQIFSESGKLGRVDVARVYAAANRSSDWLSVPRFRFIHAGTGKNAADLLLSIDAMEMAMATGFETFVIATSDGDFTHLAQRLRERGLHVLGIGEEKAPEGFRLACTEFIRLSDDNTKVHSNALAGRHSEFDKKIRNMIAQHSKDGRGMRIADLAPKMHAAHGTRISAYPERNWRAYLFARPSLYEIDPRGPDAMVRYRPDGFALR